MNTEAREQRWSAHMAAFGAVSRGLSSQAEKRNPPSQISM